MEQRLNLGCVVLAAGNASRFGENKLAADLAGRSLIYRALSAVPPEKFAAVCVVSQYPEVLRLAEEFRFSPILNTRPDLGQSRSLQMGLSRLRACDGVCFLVSDQPLLQRSSVAALADFWQKAPQELAALSHGGVRGNPCIFPDLMQLTGDTGGAAVIRRHGDILRLLEVEPQELTDVDTPETLELLRSPGPDAPQT